MSGNMANLTANLNFRVDYKKLKEYEKRLGIAQKNIQKTGDKVQKAFTKGAKKQTAALTALERRYNRHRGDLQRIRNDYYKVNQAYREGNISLEKRSRLLNEIARDYREVGRAANRANNAERSRATNNILSNQRRQTMTNAANNAGQRMRSGMLAIGGRMVAGPLAAVGGVMGAGMARRGALQSNQQYQHFEAMQTALTAITGSLEGANDQIKMLAGISEYYGTNLKSNLDSFRNWSANLLGTPLASNAMGYFEAIQAYGTSIQTSPEELQRAMKAFSDMASKGVISMEEVRGQLSEALAGSNQMLFQAGQNVGLWDNLEQMNKRISNGEIRAASVLPEMFKLMRARAYEGDAIEQARQSSRAQQNRLSNTRYASHIITNRAVLDEAVKEMFESLNDALKASEDTLKAIGLLSENLTSNLGPAIEDFAGRVNDLAGWYIKNQDKIDKVTSTAGDIINAPRKALMAFFGGVIDTIGEIRTLWGDEDSNFFIKVLKSMAAMANPLIDMFSSVTDSIFSVIERLTGVTIPNPMDAAKDFMNQGSMKPLLNRQGGVDPNKLPFGNVVIDRESARRALNPPAPPHMLAKPSHQYNIEAPVSIQIDGYNQDASELTDMIEERFSNNITSLIRGASMSEAITEK
ncbi:tape measure protein [Halomonas sp. 25-S5]|uniref:tape measure protein n=1 Tax=Halomonas sp. 25-S5 TaxID=2994065 RepID=UPI002468F986|nr:tape measure protein [Halomonas sp. 25-S5]